MIEKILKTGWVTLIYLFLIILITNVGEKLKFTSFMEEFLYLLGGGVTAWSITDLLRKLLFKENK